jgi:histidine decarboxylase
MSARQLYHRSLPKEDHIKLEKLLHQIKEVETSFVGYPTNMIFDYSELISFLGHSINNVGDPFNTSNYKMNTLEFECEVVRFFAELAELSEDEMWGYVTNGGTEGNLYGLFLARETFPDALVYYSEDTHYSVGKALRLLNMRSIMIRHQENGEMDYGDLRESLAIHREMPAIIFATVGTTMTGAVDNITKIKKILKELLIERHYIHVDAALSGMIMPFVDAPQPWSFKDGIDSMSVSGHKLIGSPIPCGVVLAKKINKDRVARAVEYVGALDTTLSGSRNGLSPLFLWYGIKRHGKDGFKKIVDYCMETAEYSVKKFNNNGIKAWRNKNSNTVVFPKPSKLVLDRWQIAVHKNIAHIITMPHVTIEQIDKIAKDIVENPN